MPAAPIDYIAKVGQEEKMLWKVTLPSTLIFSAKCLHSFLLPIFVFETTREVFLFQTAGYVVVT